MTILQVIMILITIESGGDPNAIGDSGKAVGILQIHQIVVDDVNRIYDTNYKYSDRYSKEKSIEIAQLYLKHYASEKRLGRKVMVEDVARIWNGGPNGNEKPATDPYWDKVKAEIQKQK